MTDERAERALRDALEARAADVEPSGLDVESTARRGRWTTFAASAAVIVLAAGGLFALARGSTDSAADPTDSASQAETTTVTFHDVAVSVPSVWAQIISSHCARPRESFVVTYSPVNSCRGTGTFETPSQGRIDTLANQIANVQIYPLAAASESQPDGRSVLDGWQLQRKTLGDVVVVVITRVGDTEGAAILRSVRVVHHDENGCDTTSRVQDGRMPRPPLNLDIMSVSAVRSVAVCLYQAGESGTPGLLASRLLSGTAAEQELGSIQSAHRGGGSFGDRQTCLNDVTDSVALVLRVTTSDGGVQDLYLRTEACKRNGIDDGARVAAITESNCRPLWGDRVRVLGNIGPATELCHPSGD